MNASTFPPTARPPDHARHDLSSSYIKLWPILVPRSKALSGSDRPCSSLPVDHRFEAAEDHAFGVEGHRWRLTVMTVRFWPKLLSPAAGALVGRKGGGR
jgi:hypothetical protein